MNKPKIVAGQDIESLKKSLEILFMHLIQVESHETEIKAELQQVYDFLNHLFIRFKDSWSSKVVNDVEIILTSIKEALNK